MSGNSVTPFHWQYNWSTHSRKSHLPECYNEWMTHYWTISADYFFFFLINLINHLGDVLYSCNAVTVGKKTEKGNKQENGDGSLVDVCPIGKCYAVTDWAFTIVATKKNSIALKIWTREFWLGRHSFYPFRYAWPGINAVDMDSTFIFNKMPPRETPASILYVSQTHWKAEECTIVYVMIHHSYAIDAYVYIITYEILLSGFFLFYNFQISNHWRIPSKLTVFFFSCSITMRWSAL